MAKNKAEQAREAIKLEKDYQAALKMSESMQGAINKQLSKQIDYRTKLGSKVKSYITDLQKSVEGLQDADSVSEQINKNQLEINRITKSYFGANKAVGAEKIKALKLANEALVIEEDRLRATERVNQVAEDYSTKIGEGLDTIAQKIGNIPLFGGVLGGQAKKAANAIKGKLGKASKEFTTKFKAGLDDGLTSMQALRGAAPGLGKGLMSAFLGPQAILLALIGMLAAGLFAVNAFEKGVIAFRETSGLSANQFDGLESKVSSAASSVFHMTGSLEEGAKLAGGMFNAFGGIEDISSSVLENSVKLAAGLGLSTDEIGNVNKLFQNAFGASQELAQGMVNVTVNAAKAAKVPVGKVLKDMAESSEEVYKYFKGSPQQLQKAAIQAAKLGTSIKQASSVAGGLLDFENSINSELEASAILGVNLNLSRARGLAAQGDIVGAQQEVLKQTKQLGDLTKLNVYEQEALSKATGMPIQDLINQQRIQKQLGKLKGDDLAAAQQLISSGKDLSKMSKKELEQELKNQKVAAERTSQMDQLQNSVKMMGLELASAFGPMAKDFLTWIKESMPKIKGFMKGLSEGFAKVYDFIKPILSAIGSALSYVFGLFGGGGGDKATESAEKTGEAVDKIHMASVGAGKGVAKFIGILLGGIVAFKLFKGLKSLFGGVGKSVTSVGKQSTGVLSRLGRGIGDLGKGIGNFVKGLATGIGGALKAIGQGLGGFLKGLSGGLASLANPAALIGLAAVTLAFLGLAVAIRIMGPALEPLGKMFKSIFEGIATIVVPIVNTLVNGFVKLASIIGGVFIKVFGMVTSVLKTFAQVVGGVILGIFKSLEGVIKSLSGAFVSIASVVGGVILGVFETFGGIVETVGNTIANIANIIGTTILGIFDSVGQTLGMIVENSGKAGDLFKMAAAITAVGVSLAALGTGSAVGGVASAAGGLLSSGMDWLSSKISGEKKDSGPFATLEKLASIAPQLQGVGEILQLSGEGFEILQSNMSKLAELVEPMDQLTSSMFMFAQAVGAVGEKSKKLDLSKIAGMIGLSTNITGGGERKEGEKVTLPETMTLLADGVVGLKTATLENNKSMIDKLEEIKMAIVAGAVIEMDGDAVARTTGNKMDKALGRVNQFIRSNS